MASLDAETVVAKDIPSLTKIKALEVGNRIAIAICGGLLRDAGAEVTVVQTDERTAERWQADSRYSVGKKTIDDARALTGSGSADGHPLGLV